MNEDDLIRLRHMLDSALAAINFIDGESRQSLDQDLKLVFALFRAIEIIGEAASRVSQATRDENPQIPWREIVGMRNILIHNYFDIDLDQIWKTVTGDLPPLVTKLEKLVPPDQAEP